MELTIISVITLWLLGVSAYGQTSGAFLSQLSKTMEARATEQPIEKAYLHFDKPYYAAGDNMWFKAYVTMGSNYSPSSLSSVLNVLLLNDKGAIVKTLKLLLANGSGWGDISLPESLPPGNYHITAYTNWMRNAGNNLFFNRDFVIGNSISAQAPVKKASNTGQLSTTADVQFFPEGGNLIGGVGSKVAFKAISANGKGVNVKGVIIDDAGREITTFTSTHLGMGVFNLVPESGKTYTAKLSYPDGTTGQMALPKVLDKGYVLSVNISNAGNIAVSITTNITTQQQDGNKELGLLAQANDHVYFADKIKLDGATAKVNIPLNNFRTGVVQFTLFAAEQAVNERLAFIQTADVLKLNVVSDRPVYAPRGKVQINLQTMDAAAQPVQGNFSVAVIDEGKIPVNEADESNILSQLLLTSDLRGYVEQPNYYFINTDDKTRADLDVLLLTQGYRNFEWKPLLGRKPALPIYQPEKGLTIAGKVLANNGKPVAKGKVTLLVKSSGDAIDTLTDNDGRFAFNDLIFPDSTRFVLQARTAKNTDNVIVQIADEAYAQIAEANTRLFVNGIPADSLPAQYLLNSKNKYDQDIKYGLNGHNKLLQQVDIKGQKVLKELQYSANLNGPGKADQIVLGEELENSGRLSDALQGKLTGVMFQGEKPVSVSNSYSPITENAKPTRGLQPMLPMIVILDGTMVDYTALNRLAATDVSSIEVLRSSVYLAVYGTRAGTGALVITTKHSTGVIYDTKTPGMLTYTPIGFYQSKAFYSPRYDRAQTNPQTADLRSTIFWHPNIVTNKDGNAAFDFFNADSKGNYQVVIEGMDSKGNMGRQVYRYKVE